MSSLSSGNNIEGGEEARKTSSVSQDHQALSNELDPSAEVIALSPKTLMTKVRFICEVCNKGFQREENLQLHRRGHNLPWKLKPETGSTETNKKRIYICPEPSCIHHNPAHALGDLTGIMKHYSRKHGEKKWKCEKCSKKYAEQSDWEAHSKTCDTKEYKCDCGTILSRKDSFMTHRAFCDAIAEENSKVNLPDIRNISFSTSFPGFQLGTTSSNMSEAALLQQAALMDATATIPKRDPDSIFNSSMLVPIQSHDDHQTQMGNSVHGCVESRLQDETPETSRIQNESQNLLNEEGRTNNLRKSNEDSRNENLRPLDVHRIGGKWHFSSSKRS